MASVWWLVPYVRRQILRWWNRLDENGQKDLVDLLLTDEQKQDLVVLWGGSHE